MKMQVPLHLFILLFSFTCKAEVKSNLTVTWNETFTSLKNTSDIHLLDAQTVSSRINSSYLEKTHSPNVTKYLPNITNKATTLTNMVPYTTTKKTLWYTTKYTLKSQPTEIPSNRKTSTVICNCKEDKYKTAIMICAIIIAVLVLICAVLIICTVALAHKVSRLKTKLTQSKRQARSNGDFLSASGIIWSSGIDTWQRKAQTANQTMDEISLGDTITNDEKHKLMAVPAVDKEKDNSEDKKPISNEENMTIISTLEA